MKYVKKKLSELKPYENNPRINDEAVDDVAESIKQCSYIAPIIIDEDGVILAGHTRYKALKKLGYKECEVVIASDLIEQYAMMVSRWVQCETCISEYGFLAKHPTTGAAITSPYVTMSQNYLKQVNQCWYQIYQIVKENCSVEYGGANPHDDLMEHLLTARKK